ncbi:hypothetical protein CT694_34480 (plasmid) [Bacillus wiedmannii bv. thuringiensis]|nr:hypothetical protein CT694_34480 [Bacillus wiedmannii bv. thuringiensis]
MNSEFPTYTKIFKETKIRLKEIREECSQNREISEVDDLMFYLVGNINLRLNTIFHLLGLTIHAHQLKIFYYPQVQKNVILS